MLPSQRFAIHLLTPLIAALLVICVISSAKAQAQERSSPSTEPTIAPVQPIPSIMAPDPVAATGPLSAAPSANPSGTVTSSTSASKQFIVHGADLSTRSVFCLQSDDTASALDRLLKDPALNRLPVVVVLKTAAEAQRTGPAVSTNISQLSHGGFHLQVNVQLRPGFRVENYNDELVRILLAERILRQHKELNTSRQRVLPDWLLTGVSQALKFRQRAKPSVLFAAVFRSGRVYSIDALLQAELSQLDSLSRGIYETSSCALMLTLLDQPDGAQRFGRFLNALATDSKSDRDLLQQHFPGLGVSNNSLEKWWSLQMATLATPGSFETMSVADTERLLDEALTLKYKPQEPKASKQKPAKPAAKPVATPGDGAEKEEKEDKPSRFHLPFFKQRSKDVIFPFTRRRDKENEAAAETPPAKDGDAATKDKAPAKAKEEKEAKPQPTPATDKTDKSKSKAKDTAKETTPPSSEPTATPPPSLPKKPAAKRDISDQPPATPPPSLPAKTDATRKVSEQPPIPEPASTPMPPSRVPAPAAEEKPVDAPETADSEKSEKGGTMLNPLNWFRKGETKPSEEYPTLSAEDIEQAKRDATASSRSASSIPVSTASSSEEPRLPSFTPTPSSMLPPPPQDDRIVIPLAGYEAIQKRTDFGDILSSSVERLNTLKMRGHPLYRPLFAEYMEIVRNLMQGKDKGIKEKLVQLDARRREIHAQAKEVESYVDAYVANHSGFSDDFEDYLKLRDQMEEEAQPRSDAISQYLDALDKEYRE